MGLADDTKSGIDGVLNEAWALTTGTVVPETDDVTLKNGGRALTRPTSTLTSPARRGSHRPSTTRSLPR